MSSLGPYELRRDGAAERISVWQDLRHGRAGVPLRLGLSLAAAGAMLAALFLLLGLVEQVSGRVADAQIAGGLVVAGLAWCGVLAFLWTTYRRWRYLLSTIFIALGIWIVTIPICVLIGENVKRPDFLIAGFIVTAVSSTIVVIALNAYRATAGRPLTDRMGEISVVCPACGYSMVGLESCQCPECGAAYTIDQIIGEQDYAVLRRVQAIDEAT